MITASRAVRSTSEDFLSSYANYYVGNGALYTPQFGDRKADALAADVLLDQDVFAGVGNIYRAEVLFRHGIDPKMPGTFLRREEFDAIWADLVALMPIGVATGRILTVEEDVVAAEAALAAGEPVPVPDPLVPYVYKRTGEACFVCGSRVRTAVVAGRNLFWCGRCQRR